MKFRECAATVIPRKLYKNFTPEPGKIMPIYTKKGDKGTTSLGSGKKVSKDNIRVEAYGTIDELNALLGVVGSELLQNTGYVKYLNEILKQIQYDLFSVGSYLANPASSSLIDELPKRTTVFEKYIDEMTGKMPALSNFILPGGCRAAALFQHARTVCRRAERNIVSLSKKQNVDGSVLQYLNRLSDLLFTMSRFANDNENIKEEIWKR